MLLLNDFFKLLGIVLTSYILAKYTYIATRFYPYLYLQKLGYFKTLQKEIYATFSIFRSLGKVKIKKIKYLDLFLWYLGLFGIIYYGLNLDLFSVLFFSILFIAGLIDLKTHLIPDSYLIFVSILLLGLNIYEGWWKNIEYFFIVLIISYLLYFFQLFINKFFIGIQDIKLYALTFLIFGYNLDNFWDIVFISNVIGVLFLGYFFIRYRTKIFPFGLSIVIGFMYYMKYYI